MEPGTTPRRPGSPGFIGTHTTPSTISVSWTGNNCEDPGASMRHNSPIPNAAAVAGDIRATAGRAVLRSVEFARDGDPLALPLTEFLEIRPGGRGGAEPEIGPHGVGQGREDPQIAHGMPGSLVDQGDRPDALLPVQEVPGLFLHQAGGEDHVGHLGNGVGAGGDVHHKTLAQRV